jgi:hypothetical protein
MPTYRMSGTDHFPQVHAHQPGHCKFQTANRCKKTYAGPAKPSRIFQAQERPADATSSQFRHTFLAHAQAFRGLFTRPPFFSPPLLANPSLRLIQFRPPTFPSYFRRIFSEAANVQSKAKCAAPYKFPSESDIRRNSARRGEEVPGKLMRVGTHWFLSGF